MEMHSETLTDDELTAITSYMIPFCQIGWLNKNGRQYVLTKARHPVVGRFYARMQLAGVKPSAENVAAETWPLNVSQVG